MIQCEAFPAGLSITQPFSCDETRGSCQITLKTTEEDEEEIQGVAANLSDEEETGVEAAEAACSSEPGGVLA